MERHPECNEGTPKSDTAPKLRSYTNYVILYLIYHQFSIEFKLNYLQ